MAQAGIFAFDWAGYAVEGPVAAVYQPPDIWPAGPSPEQLAEIGKEDRPKREKQRWRVFARLSFGFAITATGRGVPGMAPVKASKHWKHSSRMAMGFSFSSKYAFRDPWVKQRREEDEWLLGIR